jgi:hypothetical protein
MSIIDKIKLVLKIRKPIAEVKGELQGFKRGWKTLSFWVTLLGSLGSLAASVQGFLPAEYALIINTVLVTLYNILRGADKALESSSRPTWLSTEVWLGIVGQLNNGVLALQQGGVNEKWVMTSAAILAAAMSLGRDLANLEPEEVESPAKPS